MEARIVYIPQDDRTRPVTVHMYEAERKLAVGAIGPVAYGLSDAAAVFKLISDGLAGGQFDHSPAGVISLTSICAAHFQALAEKEGEHLQLLQRTLDWQDPAKAKAEDQ